MSLVGLDGTGRWRVEGPKREAVQVHVAADVDRVVVVSEGRPGVWFYALSDGSRWREDYGDDSTFTAAALSPDRALLALATNAGGIMLLEYPALDAIAAESLHDGGIEAIVWPEQGTLVSGGFGGEIALWRDATGQALPDWL